MSTGLTWVTLVDGTNAGDPTLGVSPIQFSDYNEAMSYAEWYVRCMAVEIVGATARAVALIYTTSPNQKGYWDCSGGASFFTAFD